MTMLSIILVNWNGWADTLSCVQSLINSECAEFRVIIVDNMSPNDSLAIFRSWARREFELLPSAMRIERMSSAGAGIARNLSFCRYIEDRPSFAPLDGEFTGGSRNGLEIHVVSSGRNGGFGFGCNVGMRLADALGTSGYWLLNNDCVIAPHVVSVVAEGVRLRPDIALGTVVRYYDRPGEIQAVGGGWLSRLTGKNIVATSLPLNRPLNYIYGASVAFSRQLRERVGYFDENIFMYYEEMDFSIRTAQAGFGFDVLPVEIFHRHGGSQGGVSANAWNHVLVNKWYVLHKHYGIGVWCLFFWVSLIIRCINPRGAPAAMIGARRAFSWFMGRKSAK